MPIECKCISLVVSILTLTVGFVISINSLMLIAPMIVSNRFLILVAMLCAEEYA